MRLDGARSLLTITATTTRDTSAVKVFALTYFGRRHPDRVQHHGRRLSWAMLPLTAAYPPYADAYEQHYLGGLISEVYHPRAWSKFCLIFLTFSVLGNNIAINYSSGLSIQLLGTWFHAVPRFIWFSPSSPSSSLSSRPSVRPSSPPSCPTSSPFSDTGPCPSQSSCSSKTRSSAARLATTSRLGTTPKKLPWGIAAVISLLAGYLAGGVPWYVADLVRWTDCEEVQRVRWRRRPKVPHRQCAGGILHSMTAAAPDSGGGFMNPGILSPPPSSVASSVTSVAGALPRPRTQPVEIWQSERVGIHLARRWRNRKDNKQICSEGKSRVWRIRAVWAGGQRHDASG
ncbi:hypothetical protein MRB53_038089 [Persea americana]|nr:hypothetical protein MRB53_038089 [Persea americana]